MRYGEIRPTALMDIDDVLCPNAPFGGLHVREALRYPHKAPPDLYRMLFSAEAVEVINQLFQELRPRFVLTTSWLSLFDRAHFLHIFTRCGLESVAGNFHPNWAAPADRGMSRNQAIIRWLQKHHDGEPFLVLDDEESGASLVGSRLDRTGRVVLCQVGACLKQSHLPAARSALRQPVYRRAPSTDATA